MKGKEVGVELSILNLIQQSETAEASVLSERRPKDADFWRLRFQKIIDDGVNWQVGLLRPLAMMVTSC